MNVNIQTLSIHLKQPNVSQIKADGNSFQSIRFAATMGVLPYLRKRGGGSALRKALPFLSPLSLPCRLAAVHQLNVPLQRPAAVLPAGSTNHHTVDATTFKVV